MSPEDVRHGTPGGYIAHRRDNQDVCGPCLIARRRAAKSIELDHLRGVRMIYSPAEVEAVLTPWLHMGLTIGAVAVAAGMSGQYGGHVYQMFRGERTGARRSSYRRLAAVTEDDFGAKAKVYADLTRQRVGSLMVAGHQLRHMPITLTGNWRTRRHISVETARAVRDHYRALEFTLGTSAHTAARARNAGHRAPLTWDDPDTLAWPLGHVQRQYDPYIDPDRATALTDLDALGLGITEVCARLGVRRDNLERWCQRHGMSETYVRLTGRECWAKAAS